MSVDHCKQGVITHWPTIKYYWCLKHKGYISICRHGYTKQNRKICLLYTWHTDDFLLIEIMVNKTMILYCDCFWQLLLLFVLFLCYRVTITAQTKLIACLIKIIHVTLNYDLRLSHIQMLLYEPWTCRFVNALHGSSVIHVCC